MTRKWAGVSPYSTIAVADLLETIVGIEDYFRLAEEVLSNRTSLRGPGRRLIDGFVDSLTVPGFKTPSIAPPQRLIAVFRDDMRVNARREKLLRFAPSMAEAISQLHLETHTRVMARWGDLTEVPDGIGPKLDVEQRERFLRSFDEMFAPVLVSIPDSEVPAARLIALDELFSHWVGKSEEPRAHDGPATQDIWDRIILDLAGLSPIDPAWAKFEEAKARITEIAEAKREEREGAVAVYRDLQDALTALRGRAERLEELGFPIPSNTSDDAVEFDNARSVVDLAHRMVELADEQMAVELQAIPRDPSERRQWRERLTQLETEIGEVHSALTAHFTQPDGVCNEALASEPVPGTVPNDNPETIVAVGADSPADTAADEVSSTPNTVEISPTSSDTSPEVAFAGLLGDGDSDTPVDGADSSAADEEVSASSHVAELTDDPVPDEVSPSSVPDPAGVTRTEFTRAAAHGSEPPVPDPVERPSLPGVLSPPLIRFDDYAANKWIGHDLRVANAPWEHSHFGHHLTEAAMRALRSGRFGILRVLCAAAETLGLQPLFAGDDLDAAALIWRSPASLGVGLSADRAQRLSHSASGDASPPSALAMSAVLEALRPSRTNPLAEADVKAVSSSLDFANSHLKSLIGSLLLLHCRNADPVVRLRRISNDSTSASPEEHERRIDRARAAFAKSVQMLATGGRVTSVGFARRVWRQSFDELVKPLSDVLTKLTRDGDYRSWDLDELRHSILRIPEKYARLADAGDVHYAARDQMDKAMDRLVEGALAVVEAVDAFRRPVSRKVNEANLPVEQLRSLTESEPLPAAVEEFLRRLALRALTSVPSESRDPWRLGWMDLCEYPDLLLLVADTSVAGGEIWSDLSPRWIADATRASAVLLEDGRKLTTTNRDEALLGLHRHARETGRPELAVFVASAGVLTAHEKNLDRRELFELTSASASSLRLLEQREREVDELGLRIAAEVRLLCQDARWLARNEQWMARHFRLFSHWVDELARRLEGCIAERVSEMREAAAKLPVDRRALVDKYLAARNFPHAVEVLYSKSAATSPARQKVRETLYRDEANQRYGNPSGSIQKLGKDAPKLVAAWTDPRPTGNVQRTMRIQLYEFLETGAGAKSSQKVPRSGETNFVSINLEGLRRLFKNEGLNPTFTPQIQQLSELVIVSAGVSDVSKRTETSDDVIRSIVGVPEYGNRLVIALAPAISSGVRERAISEIRSRSIVGALIDDLDLCRLLQLPQGHRRWIGLLEIAFEQINWTQIWPFVLDDGQFVRREMFVGRSQEAKDLAQTTKYSRIFSGRRLGKSALLKFVEMQFQGATLASGNRLTTIYIGAAGSQPETYIVSDIIEHVEKRFDVDLSCAEDLDPGERLVRTLKLFAAKCPTDSLLIVLDEADVFVEEQLVEYDRHAEACLAFRMVKAFGDVVDKFGAPRIRFVVAGYRVTNTSYGPWFNSGEVLKLPPLGEHEAARLIEGPLARLGVDASAEAGSIARRCGYQPAVLLKFGDALLRRLYELGAAPWRGRVEVTRDDVFAVFSDDPVSEEVRYVTEQNFGNHNPVGSIVFTAVLWALSELPSAWCLENAAERILGYIERADPDTSWLKQLDPTEVGEIEGRLRDLVERQLLDKLIEGDTTVYRLKFPHLLPLLLARIDPALNIRNAIERLKTAGGGRGTVTSILTSESLNTLDGLSQNHDPGYPVDLAVVAGHWTTALDDDRSGFASRLGYDKREIVRANGALNGAVHSRRLCVVAATPELAEEILAERKGGLPAAVLTGGVDLLRWAVRKNGSAELNVDVFPLRRVTIPALAWWFERARGHAFEDSSAIARIHSATSGIPLLVRAIDTLLDGPRGDLVSSSRLNSALEALDNEIPTIARRLVDGPPGDRMTAREIELLRMVAAVSEVGKASADEVLCGELWDALFASKCPGLQPLHSQDDDQLSLDMLRLTGLAPLDALSRLEFVDGDMVNRIVDAMGA